MKIIYIDPVELTHTSIKEVFKDYDVAVFRDINSFVEKLDVVAITEFQVIIIDCLINTNLHLDDVLKLTLFRSLSQGRVKIVHFTDQEKIRSGFNRVLLSPDFEIDKKSKLTDFITAVDKILETKFNLQNNLRNNFCIYPTLTINEFRYVVSFLRGRTIKEIAESTNQDIKFIYRQRLCIYKKYNFKGIADFHAALTYAQ